MVSQYPMRPESHNLEDLSKRHFVNSLPRDWTHHTPSEDYGIDLRVDIFENGLASGLELLIQLKSSQKACNGTSETVRLRVSTYNHLWDKLQVVMLIKFIEEANEAYWLLLKDVPAPNQEQQTFTVHIPKQNTLSNIDWNAIREYVRQVQHEKLQVRRTRIG
jgi:hypothetical protein